MYNVYLDLRYKVKATQPVPGNNTLAANLMARAWNSSTELQTMTTIGAAKSVAWKWAHNLGVLTLSDLSQMGRKKKENSHQRNQFNNFILLFTTTNPRL